MIVLVADDDAAIRELIVAILTLTLKQSKLSFLQAADGREALDLGLRNHVDLVISDLQMPRMNGDELIRRLTEQMPNLPVILMSGNHDELTNAALLCPCQVKILHKPFSIGELLGFVEKLTSYKPAA